MLMNLETLDWDDELLGSFDIPRQMLPDIRPSSTTGRRRDRRLGAGRRRELPIIGILGDQQAGMVGQDCLDACEAKNNYGTGNFLLLNTGENIVRSQNGLLTTVCYQLNDAKPVYALEGSIAATGSAVQWLRDQLGIISGASQSESLARQVEDNGGVYFVPRDWSTSTDGGLVVARVSPASPVPPNHVVQGPTRSFSAQRDSVGRR